LGKRAAQTQEVKDSAWPAEPKIKGHRTWGDGAEAHRSVLPAPSYRPRKMRLAVRALLACAVLGLCLAVSPEKTVRWCTVSSHEASKCSSFMENMKTVLENGPFVSCVKKTSYLECIKAISSNEADAVTLDAGLVFEAGLTPYNLKPVVAEFYGTEQGKFFLGTQERVCGSCSLLVDAEFVLSRQVMEIKY